MDIRDDAATIAATTDYDSGDSLGVDYVYEWQTRAEKGIAETKSPRRKISPRPKPSRITKCVCGGRRADEGAEITIFEDTTDTSHTTDSEHSRHLQSHPTPSRLAESCGGPACEEGGHHKADKKKSRRTWTPYIEEYPDEAPRPALLLREHKISRSPSPSEAKPARNSEDRSSSGTSTTRSPNGIRPLPRSPRQTLGKSPKHPGHRGFRLDLHGGDKPPGADAVNLSSDASEHRCTMSRRSHSHQESRPKPASSATRSSAWNDNHQLRYSSSWPLHTGARLPQRHLDPRELGYESDEESERRHRPRQTRASSFREKDRDRDREQEHQRPGPLNQRWERDREHEHEHEPEPEPEPEPARERESRPPQRPRSRPRTVTSRPSIGALDRGRCSVATSLCEVWRGRPEDWESPYASGSDELDDSDVNRDDQPIRLLRLPLRDLPSRAASPSRLPPRPPSGQRSDFAFSTTATDQLPDSESPPPLGLLGRVVKRVGPGGC